MKYHYAYLSMCSYGCVHITLNICMKIRKFNQLSRCPQISTCLAYGQNSWTFVFHFIFFQMLVSYGHNLSWSPFLPFTFGIITELLKKKKKGLLYQYMSPVLKKVVSNRSAGLYVNVSSQDSKQQWKT